jgi:hypothetical protein
MAHWALLLLRYMSGSLLDETTVCSENRPNNIATTAAVSETSPRMRQAVKTTISDRHLTYERN